MAKLPPWLSDSNPTLSFTNSGIAPHNMPAEIVLSANNNIYTLSIPPHTNIANLVLLYTATTQEENLELIINVGANAQVTLIESYYGQAASNLAVNAKIFLATASSLTHVLWQENLARITCTHEVNAAHKAKLTSHIHSIHTNATTANYTVALQGAECENTTYALLHGQQKNSHNLNLKIAHLAEQGKTQATIRSIAQDTATTDTVGLIVVNKEAALTQAHLESKSILLNTGAVAKNRPQLNIYNGNVQCSHGSSTGELDNAALFYLQSRGISYELAKNILLTAFLQPVLPTAFPALLNTLQNALDLVV